MELIDHKAVMAIRDKAYRAIQADKEGLWKLWHQAKTEWDREVLMTHVMFQQSFDEGYSRGYDEGFDEGYQRGTVDNFNPDAPSENY